MSSIPGSFIQPDRDLEALADPNSKLQIPILSGHRTANNIAHLSGQNIVFDELLGAIAEVRIPYEDQCTAQYYFDLVTALTSFAREYNRVVEVGVFMGGASVVFAGLMDRVGYSLDLVDINAVYLRFAYERIRRTFPGAASRVRLFQGSLPAYVKYVLQEEGPSRWIVHHDAAHDFTQVTKDMASLSFVREKLVAVIAQDTNLRGTQYMNFVDLALYAVFGANFSYAPMGSSYKAGHPLTRPDQYQGNYSLPDAPEGMLVPMSANRFQYPDPQVPLDFFL